MLRQLHARGRAVLFTSHVLADVDELCASMAVLEAGRLRFCGSPAGLRERYAEAGLEQAFMKCIKDRGGDADRNGPGTELH
jgi:ABC-type Na+ transport system ATPase subunit NatA